MTATDELRRLLDERGVEWQDHSGSIEQRTVYRTPNGWCYVSTANDKWLSYVEYHDMTPEQAVEATLGRGTCQDLSGTGANGEQVFKCSECGCVLSLYDRDGSNNLCTSFIFDYPRYCPECGRKVVE